MKGTLDQVREINGRLVLHDIKTGKMHSGIDMLSVHALQLCAYQIGATMLLKRRVEDATIIRVQDYDTYVRGEKKGTRYGPVFWQALWKYDDCLRILDGVRHKVAQIRAGVVYAVPGPQCRWCDQMSLSNCLPRLHELGGES